MQSSNFNEIFVAAADARKLKDLEVGYTPSPKTEAKINKLKEYILREYEAMTMELQKEEAKREEQNKRNIGK